MKNFAVIKNVVVDNVIVAETKEIAELVTGLTCVEYTEENPAGIGWTYDGTSFTPPAVQETNPPA
jgi:hypothetical protein